MIIIYIIVLIILEIILSIYSFLYPILRSPASYSPSFIGVFISIIGVSLILNSIVEKSVVSS